MSDVVCPPGTDDRLDRVLAALVPGMSRSEARRLIAAGSVFVDGRRCRVASRTVRAGARLRLESAPAAPSTRLRVLHQDPSCVAIDKPAGMPTAPTRQAAAGSAQDELERQLGRAERLWLVHRLDRDTSGVLLFARTRAAARALDAAFRERKVDKRYQAWVAGVVDADSGRVTAPLRESGRRAMVDPAGKAAETHWEVVERGADRTLLNLRPTTGRMHQIRVHLQSIGHPVIGDRLYGGPRASRLMLHATRLAFSHPVSGEPLEITAPASW